MVCDNSPFAVSATLQQILFFPRKSLQIMMLLAFSLPGLLWSASAPISFVQVNSATPQSSPTSLSVTYNAVQTAGDLNVIAVGWNNSTTTIQSVTDTKGNVYQLAVGPTVVSGFLSQSIYYAKNVVGAAAGTNSVTVQFSAATAFPDIRILEYSGADLVNPVDVSAAATGNSASSNSGSATTTNATDLIFGAGTTTSRYTGSGSGFTQRIITTPDGDIAEDRNVTAVGSYNAVAPQTSGRWVMQMVAFRTAGSIVDTTAPTSPAGVTATPTGSTQINLSWTPSTDNVGVTQYLIERCQGASCSGFSQVGVSSGPSFNDTGLANATSYSYRVRAGDAANNLSNYSAVATATTGQATPPVFVTEVHSATDGPGFNVATLPVNVSGTNTLLIASWHAEWDGPFTESNCPQCWTVTFAGVPGTVITATNGYNGGAGNQRFRTYYWLNPPQGTNNLVVADSNTLANELAVSAVLFANVSQTTPIGAPVLDVSTTPRTSESETVNSSTSDLVLHVIADASFVTGTLGTGETSRSLANDGFTKLGAGDGDASLWLSTKPGAAPTTTVSSSGWPGSPAPAPRVVNGVGIPIHGADVNGPTGLTASAISASQINLNWAAPSGAFTVANYLIERCQGANCTGFAQVGTSPAGTTTFSDTGLAASTSYSYRVRATNGSGNFTGYSNVSSATTQAGYQVYLFYP